MDQVFSLLAMDLSQNALFLVQNNKNFYEERTEVLRCSRNLFGAAGCNFHGFKKFWCQWIDFLSVTTLESKESIIHHTVGSKT